MPFSKSNQQNSVHMSVGMHATLLAELDQMAQESGSSREDVFKKSFALLFLAHRAKKDGYHIGLVEDETKLDFEIVNAI